MDGCALLLLLLSLSFALAPGSSAKGNYYEALDLEPTATRSQIKRAFRSLALKFHPDKNKGAEAERRFRDIAEAYKVLSSSEERKLYDRLGHDAFVKNSSGVPQEDTPSFDDIFSFFEAELFDTDTDFMWTFPDDVVHEYHSFHSPEFTFVFSDGENEFEEDAYF